ncbi:hypothetical protein GCM10020001_024520 [Nonomuraea salmonea]
MIAPPPASAAEPDPGAPANKIASDLKGRFRTEPVSDFWITFDAKADLAPAMKIADWTARGQFVYDALKAAAKSSAASVSAQLDAAGVKYTSYPLVNAVLVKGGTQKLALDVASVGQVAEIHASPQVALVQPIDEKTPDDQAARPAAPPRTPPRTPTRTPPRTPTRTPTRTAPSRGAWTPFTPPEAWAMGGPPVRASPCPTSTRVFSSTTPP